MDYLKFEKKESSLRNKKGFSLLEVLIALFVMTIGMLGMLTLITKSITGSAESRDLITASQIAHEGIELVKWIRDNNMAANPSTPAKFFDKLDPSSPKCKIDHRVASNLSYFICEATEYSSYALYYNDPDDTGIFPVSYNHESSKGGQTKFFRKIFVGSTADPDERIVRAFVFWGTGWNTPPADDATDCLAIKNCIYSEIKLTKRGN